MHYNIKIISKGSEFILESEDRKIIEREMDTYFAHLFEASEEFIAQIEHVVINKPVKSIESFEALSKQNMQKNQIASNVTQTTYSNVSNENISNANSKTIKEENYANVKPQNNNYAQVSNSEIKIQSQAEVKPRQYIAPQINTQPKVNKEEVFISNNIEIVEEADNNIVFNNQNEQTKEQDIDKNTIITKQETNENINNFNEIPQVSEIAFKNTSESTKTFSQFNNSKSIDELITLADEQIDIFDGEAKPVDKIEYMEIQVESDVPTIDLMDNTTQHQVNQPAIKKESDILIVDENLKERINLRTVENYSTQAERKMNEENYQNKLDNIFADFENPNQNVEIQTQQTVYPAQETQPNEQLMEVKSDFNKQEVIENNPITQNIPEQSIIKEEPMKLEIDFELNEPQEITIDYSKDSKEQIELALQNQTKQTNDLNTLFQKFATLDSIQDHFLICAYYIKYALGQPDFTIKSVNSKLFQTTGNIADMVVVDELIAKEYIKVIPCEDYKKYCITPNGEEFLSSRFQD